MEHAVSAEVVDRLYESLGRPAACPHGNPIPGPQGLPAYAGSVTMDRALVGVSVRVARIAEDAEENAEDLALFDRLGLRPGCRLRILPEVIAGRVRFAAGGEEAEMPSALASKVWTDPDDPQ